MNQLLIATTNQAKLSELKTFLSDLPIELTSLTVLGITKKPEETGETCEENALIKARFYGKISGLATLADDGGFEIDALDGAPGVKAHRWVNQDREDTDDEIIEHVQKKLTGLPAEKRGAQLRLALALVLPSGESFTVTDLSRGVIPENISEKRETGFPYRTLLYFPEIEKFYNQLTENEMAEYNHRKRAVEKMKPIIKGKLC